MRDFPGATVDGNPPANAGDKGSIPGLGRSPGAGRWQPIPVLPGKRHGLRSLEGYNPQHHEELVMT